MNKFRIFLAMSLILLASAVQAETRLIMIEERGCVWCAKWNREIAPIYPKTTEGRAAPLHRINIRQAKISRYTFARSRLFTPTFVLMQDGIEISRIEGYPGEAFFWELLAQMIKNKDTAQTTN